MGDRIIREILIILAKGKSQVPVSTAAWLFISGLLGFANVASRKR
ncbi:MAG: hypothetical protein Q8N35_02425 [Methylococcaceae bacterium]|nr:hypothetical protein [Methylococcaceae bacterium]MDZ4156836.1 hypothetical protein [Methylococcales bacterium]MDP2391746.1 hypothetical protein [Methylococcaceae bacterium]MDP3018420.1 hypothetical protein [Methylococcaceae bacterium]MDP3389462.1 hypothetical protein [Methylococcaceae bacterium]